MKNMSVSILYPSYTISKGRSPRKVFWRQIFDVKYFDVKYLSVVYWGLQQNKIDTLICVSLAYICMPACMDARTHTPVTPTHARRTRARNDARMHPRTRVRNSRTWLMTFCIQHILLIIADDHCRSIFYTIEHVHTSMSRSACFHIRETVSCLCSILQLIRVFPLELWATLTQKGLRKQGVGESWI